MFNFRKKNTQRYVFFLCCIVKYEKKLKRLWNIEINKVIDLISEKFWGTITNFIIHCTYYMSS